MKKALLILLALCLLCGLFAGCENGKDDGQSASGGESGGEPKPEMTLAPAAEEPEPEDSDTVRVLIDLQYAQERWVEGTPARISDYNIRKAMQQAGWDGEFAFEFLPAKGGEERTNALQRMRIEIMAGAGPDVFILASTETAYGPEPLFRYPEQMMDRNTFLPLDDAIKNAKYMEWDKFIPQVMEAGRNEEGQQILPLCYSIPVTLFKAEEVQHEHSPSMTFQDLADSSDPALRLAAAFSRVMVSERQGGIMDYAPARWRLEGVFPRLADYDTEELVFTRDELLDVINTQLELGDLWDSPDRPAAFQERLRGEMSETGESQDPYYEGISNPSQGSSEEDRSYTMIPLYNTRGGCTAVVPCYAAINRNTQHPEEAFLLLDYIMSKECMQTSFYEKIFTFGLPVHRELLQPEEKVPGVGSMLYDMNQENYEELQSLLESVTGARFRDMLDLQMEELRMEAGIKHFLDTHDDPQWDDMREYYKDSIEDMVDESCRLMKMMLGES